MNMNKFMKDLPHLLKIVCAIGLAICAISHIFTEYPAWMVSFGYIFVALAIWIIIKKL